MKRPVQWSALLLAALLVIAVIWGAATRDDALPIGDSSAGLGLMLLEKDKGLYVLAVTEGSPADRAGICPGDYIVRAGEAPLVTADQLDLLIDADGGPIRLKLHRSDQVLNVLLPLR